jgi:hypothetical protein
MIVLQNRSQTSVEVSLKIAAATQADSDTRSEIQTLVNDAPGLAAAKKSTIDRSLKIDSF